MHPRKILVGLLTSLSLGILFLHLHAEDSPKVAVKGIRQDGLIPVNPQGTVLVDKASRKVLMKTRVVLRRGMLELFCCLRQTKEHESILAVDSKAQDVHAALLLIGAKPGTPVKYDPEFKPATGMVIDLFVEWVDKDGKTRREPAQKWVRRASQRYFVAPLQNLPSDLPINEDSEMRYDPKHHELFWFGVLSESQKQYWLDQSEDGEYQAAIRKIFEESQIQEMKTQWVFAGSFFGRDEERQQEFYAAEDGDLICVSNFSNATLDITAQSANDNSRLVYEAYQERIPPLETEVTLQLVPRFEEPIKDETTTPPEKAPLPETPPAKP